jgi:hypothetical protein
MTTTTDPGHGTRARYYRGCRCEPCKDANRTYARELTRRQRHGAPAYRSASEARAHIADLRAAGVGLKTIAAASGVSHGALSKLIYGDRTRNRAPSKRIRPDTHDRIMAVTIDAVAPGARIDATATWALIDHMTAAGVPKSAIAAELGQSGPGLQLSRRQVTADNAARVADIHARWLAGDLELVRRDRHGGIHVIEPPDTAPDPTADPTPIRKNSIDHLYDAIADIVTARTEPWRQRAQCRNHPTWVFFPGRGDNRTIDAARRICETCPVQTECAAAGEGVPHGIWAGQPARTRNAA